MSGCLGDALAALVDGELDHAARERVHRHLAHCPGCREQVDEQRRVKARVRAAAGPSPGCDLTARLLAVAAADAGPGTGSAPGDGRPALAAGGGSDGVRSDPLAVVGRSAPRREGARAGRRAGRSPSEAARDARPAARPVGAAVPAGRAVRALGRRATAGTAFALLGVAAAVALGAPPQRQTSTPVDPTTRAFVTEFVSTTGTTSPAERSGMTFLPATRAALLPSTATVTGGVGSTR